MGRFGLIAVAPLLLMAVSFAQAEDLTIVKDGQSDFEIVTRENPQPREAFAAEELAR